MNVTVRVVSNLRITTGSLPELTIGRYYEAWVEAVGGAGSYTFGAIDLPPGVRIVPTTGKIYGEEGNTDIQVGTYFITIQVRDANGSLAEKRLTLEVYVDAFVGPGGILTPEAEVEE